MTELPPSPGQTETNAQLWERRYNEQTATCVFTATERDTAREVVDLMLDDILRIKAALKPHTPLPETFVTEIEGICDRAVNYTRQRVPLIVQRDEAERERDRLRLENYDLKQKLVYMEDVTAPDGRPSFQQGGSQHEIQEVVTAKFCTGLVERIVNLRETLARIMRNSTKYGGLPVLNTDQVANVAAAALTPSGLWVCHMCGHEFEETDSIGVDISETSDERAVACPKCGSNNLDNPGSLSTPKKASC